MSAQKGSKPRTFQYRRISFQKGSNNFQALVRQALQKRNIVGDRFEELNAEEGTHRFINTHRNQFGMTFGNMLVFSEGTNKQLVTVDKSASELDVGQIALSAKDGKPREFLDSILYYGIKDNHLILLQSLSLTSKQFEQHINWLLSDTDVLDEDDGAYLNDYPARATQKKIKKQHVKSVRIGTPLIEDAELGDETMQVKQSRKVRFKPKGPGIDIVKRLLGNSEYDKLRLDDALSDSNLEVFVEVSYSRKTSDDSQKVLDHLATSLRHIDEDDIHIELKGGSKIRGKDLKLSHRVNIETYGGLVNPTDVFHQMRDWLEMLVANEMIDT